MLSPNFSWTEMVCNLLLKVSNCHLLWCQDFVAQYLTHSPRESKFMSLNPALLISINGNVVEGVHM